MPRLRENGNNVCIFFMKKKLSSYLVPIFFLLPTHFFTSNIGYGLKLELFDILVFLCTLKLLCQTHLEGKLSQVYYLSHEKKIIFLSATNIFFAAHRIFFLLSSVIKSCPKLRPKKAMSLYRVVMCL